MSKPCSTHGEEGPNPVSRLCPQTSGASFTSSPPPSSLRIAGDTALDKNIHQSVSEQIKKNFAKSKWKVRLQPLLSNPWPLYTSSCGPSLCPSFLLCYISLILCLSYVFFCQSKVILCCSISPSSFPFPLASQPTLGKQHGTVETGSALEPRDLGSPHLSGPPQTRVPPLSL